jgi:Stress responsive A/B Barrel Domain
MFVHSVYFWLTEPDNPVLLAAFENSLHQLLTIPQIVQGYIGRPATTRNEVIIHSYQFALTLLFKDLAAHDQYQIHPVHEAFSQEYADYFAKVVVYDAQ